MTSSEDRWVYPTEGEDPRDLDDATRHAESVEGRQTSHDQDAERAQGLSSDKPGVDVSEREEAAEVAPEEAAADEREIGEPGTT
jgi:hypothetical protein